MVIKAKVVAVLPVLGELVLISKCRSKCVSYSYSITWYSSSRNTKDGISLLPYP